jgi:type I restriction enzyme M protein
MNKQQLASKIWEAANQMRSKIEANEYKDYILGFIFYKFLSEKEVKYAKDNDFTDEDIRGFSEEDTDTYKYIQDNVGYFISYPNLFSTWISMGKDFDVSNVTDALSAFNRSIKPTHKKVFENIFNTLETGLSKLGESAASRTKAISDLIQLINEIPMDNKQDYDVLGFIYEYLIAQFASNAGKKAGEFYTPHEVSLLMSEIVANHLKDRKTIQIYDPTSGSGSLLINIGRSVAKHIDDENNIKYYAQELKANTYNLTRMNLVMRGILPDNIVTRNGDTLETDWPYFDENDPVNTYNPLYVDAVVSNPPYSQKWDPSDKENDPRYARFGLAPKGKADYAFLLHDLYHLKPDGIMTIVLPHGVLFRGGEEGTIRKNLIEENHIDAIIGLPANIFFGTGIPTIIMVLKQRREETNVLIVDASKGFIKEGKNNKLRACDIKKVVDTITARESIDKYSRVVSKEEIRSNDYNLNIPRYVDSSEKAESWDIYSSMYGGIPNHEIDELKEYWKAFPQLKQQLFKPISDQYSEINTTDIKETINSSTDVQSFIKGYADKISSLKDVLNEQLIGNAMNINISKEENEISEDIRRRLQDIPLVDYYEAYELFDQEWNKISVDLEMIQTEGFETAKKVDPKMIIKKKGSKEEEVQDGWVGHIFPFELIQKTLLHDDYQNLKDDENKLEDITSDYSELLDSFSDEEKESDSFTDEKDAFVPANVNKEIKQIRADIKKGEKFDSDSYESKLLSYETIALKEKKIKAQIKTLSIKLIANTKSTIENLTDEQVKQLLVKKWITPLMDSLNQMPVNVLDTLKTKVTELSEKYDTTFESIEEDIRKTEKSLSGMIDQLDGDEYDMKALNEFKKLLSGE